MIVSKFCIRALCLGLMISSPSLAAEAASSSAPVQAAPSRSAPRLAEPSDPKSSLWQLSETSQDLRAALQALRAQAGAAGSVKVAVKLAVRFAPETLLTEADKLQQRREISAAAKTLRAAMLQAKELKSFDDLPYVVLEVDVGGLDRLVSISGLSRITRAEALNWPRDFVELRSGRAGLPQAAAPAELTTVSPQVFGGRDAGPDVHPFQVGLRFRASDYDVLFCGGTLISERFIVTTASCSDFADPLSVEVLVGSKRLNGSLNGSGRRVGVKRIVLHPSFRTNQSYARFDYNVAVWELETPVTGIPFASLAPTQPTLAGQSLRATGWELTGLYPNFYYPEMLQQIDLPYVPIVDGKCMQQSDLTPRMICAGGNKGQAVCGSDAGGPLTVDRGSGFTELVGIGSQVSGCGREEGYPGIYTNVANASINSFIRSIALKKEFNVERDAYVTKEANGKVFLTVERGSPEGAASVNYSFIVGTAVIAPDPSFSRDSSGKLIVKIPPPGSGDFFRSQGFSTINFAPGQSSARLEIGIIDDSIKEGDEVFSVSLMRPSPGWSIGEIGTADVLIVDND